MERAAATFDAAQRPGGAQQSGDGEPQHCVLLRAGGHMSVLDMEQGDAPSRAVLWGPYKKCVSCFMEEGHSSPSRASCDTHGKENPSVGVASSQLPRSTAACPPVLRVGADTGDGRGMLLAVGHRAARAACSGLVRRRVALRQRPAAVAGLGRAAAV